MSKNQNTSSENSRALDLVSFVALLYEWRKFLIIQIGIVSVVAVIIALIIPKTFSSSATILPPGESSALTAFLPQSMTQGLSGVLGSSAFDKGGETNKIIAILYSRNLAEKTIRQFNLMDRFEAENIEDALMTFREKIDITINEETMVNVTTNFKTEFFHPEENEEKVRRLTKDICDFLIYELDQVYTSLGTQKARYQLQMVERRYKQNREELIKLEEEMKQFSEKYGIIALPEQTEALIKTLAELESQIAIEEIKLEIAKNSFSNNSVTVQSKTALVNELSNKLNELKVGSEASNLLSTLPTFKTIPELGLKYARLTRELTVQNLIYEFLTQQREQLRMQETKDTPSIQFIDLPQVPTKRTSPTRSLLVIALVFGGVLLCVFYIILYSYYTTRMATFVERVKKSSHE
ncbi:MAG: hypothetical protein FH748_11755 [Balneolaceae bacterium]|nr:hypothetical protein [Balneolaceae bacterium]